MGGRARGIGGWARAGRAREAEAEAEARGVGGRFSDTCARARACAFDPSPPRARPRALARAETQPYTLAVQFYPRPTRNDGGAAGRGGGGEQVLLSKFNAGLRGEYRLGLDAHGRPFVGREAEPWALLAPEPVSPNCWHSAVGVYDGETLCLFVDHVLVAQAPSAAQFCDQVSSVLVEFSEARRDRPLRSPPDQSLVITFTVTCCRLRGRCDCHHRKRPFR